MNTINNMLNVTSVFRANLLMAVAALFLMVALPGEAEANVGAARAAEQAASQNFNAAVAGHANGEVSLRDVVTARNKLKEARKTLRKAEKDDKRERKEANEARRKAEAERRAAQEAQYQEKKRQTRFRNNSPHNTNSVRLCPTCIYLRTRVEP